MTDHITCPVCVGEGKIRLAPDSLARLKLSEINVYTEKYSLPQALGYAAAVLVPLSVALVMHVVGVVVGVDGAKEWQVISAILSAVGLVIGFATTYTMASYAVYR